jgi:Tol biopolymer transport system component
MIRTDQLERELTAWFADTATPRAPDFIDDILNATAGTDQRPRWSFSERWIPMSVITLGRQTFKPLPWRTIGLLAVLALLLAAALALYIGSRQPRLPAPFGLAANGLVAYAHDGDIYVVDPAGGARHAIVTGPEGDHEPRFSLDGTHIAFLRNALGGDVVVIADADGRNRVVAKTHPFIDLDPDSLAWSPDGRLISIVGALKGSRGIYIIDTATGTARPLATDVEGLDVQWRPPDGRQLMVFGGPGPTLGLYLFTVADGTVAEVAPPDGLGSGIRLSGWTPDGQRVIYTRANDAGHGFTHVVDLTTGEEVIIDAAWAHVSNDGSRIVAINERDHMCVAKIVGGPCTEIGKPSEAYGGTHAAGVQWSPDDQWILSSRPVSGARSVIVDPDGANQDQPSWLADGGESWQRKAP